MEDRKVKCEKKIHPIFNKIDMLDKGIREIERKIQVTSTDAKKEKELIKEMQSIKESKPFILEAQELKDKIFKKKGEKFETGLGLKELKEEFKTLSNDINKKKSVKEEVATNKDGIKK